MLFKGLLLGCGFSLVTDFWLLLQMVLMVKNYEAILAALADRLLIILLQSSVCFVNCRAFLINHTTHTVVILVIIIGTK